MKVLGSIIPPVLGALLGWLLAEPWHDDFSWGRDWALVTLPVIGIIFITWISPYIIHKKWKLLREDFKVKKLFINSLVGVALVFWGFEWFVKDNTPRDFEKNHVVLCLDASGSMDEDLSIEKWVRKFTGQADKTALGELKRSVGIYLKALANAESEDLVACVAFQSEAVPIAPLTVNYNELLNRVNQLSASGGTNMTDGLRLSYSALNGLPESLHAQIILVSDGKPYNTHAVDDIIKGAGNIPITTVGVGSDFDESLLRKIANYTGGKFYSAANIEKLPVIFADLAQSVGVTQSTWVDQTFVGISAGFRLLFWSLLGAVIGIALGRQTSQSIMQGAVLLGGIVGGALSALAFLALDALHVNGSTMRMLTFALFGLIVGLSIFYVKRLFRQFSKRKPLSL